MERGAAHDRSSSLTRVIVTGGAGFLGRFVVEGLRNRKCAHIVVPRSRDYDLRTEDGIDRLYEHARPDLVIHLSAHVGGIGLRKISPPGT